ncbi:hypothetical protein BKA80DRAFT_317436 [Phyllosticta citrichinensis]
MSSSQVFVGTPHHGSNWTAWAHYAKGIFAIAQRAPNKDLIDILTPDTTQLKVLSESFDNVSGGIPKYCCYEIKSTCIPGMDFGLLLKQVPETLPILQRYKEHSEPWTVYELKRAFIECVQTIPRVFLCIDGLDEYVSTRDASVQAHFAEDRDDNHLDIIRFIQKFKENNPRLKLCVSSRQHDKFASAFKDTQRLKLHELTKDDILALIDNYFDTIGEDRWRFTIHSENGSQALERWNNPSQIWVAMSPRDVLREEVSENSSGVFLWVELVVGRLEKLIERTKSTLTELVEYLRKSRGELDDLFDDMYDEILEEDREEGLIYIQMIRENIRVNSKLACGSYPTLSERLAPNQHFSKKFGELSDENLRDLKDRQAIRLEK